MTYTIEDLERDEGAALYDAAADRWQKRKEAEAEAEDLYDLWVYGWEKAHNDDMAYGLLSREQAKPSLWDKRHIVCLEDYGTFGQACLSLPYAEQLKASVAFARYDMAKAPDGHIVGDLGALADLKWILFHREVNDI